LIKYGQNNGFDVYRDPRVSKSFVGKREATEEEYKDIDKTYALFNKRIEASANRVTGDDDNVRTALGEDFFKRPWGYTVASNWGVWGMAQNSRDYSPVDWWNSEGGGQHFCREGYGTLVAHYGREVPVTLSAWVTEIDWRGDGVKVISSAGTIKAKAAILTVSVGVLANSRIKFTPELPLKKQEAIDGIDMGVMDYIGLQFTDDVFGFDADVYVDQQQHDENGVGYMANMSGTNLVYSYVGGDQAKALENENMDVAIAYGLDGMKSMLGNDIEKKFVKVMPPPREKYLFGTGHILPQNRVSTRCAPCCVKHWPENCFSLAKPVVQPGGLVSMAALMQVKLQRKMPHGISKIVVDGDCG
jgi:hypothetical protein